MEIEQCELTLEYTGERMVPEAADPKTFWEHIYRYRFACSFVAGKVVLDIACGEGYGSAALAKAGAKKVIGVDISSEACAHASKKYVLDARVGDALNIPLAAESVDVVISFETIEHVSDPARFLDECRRVLKPDGVLVVSTPNCASYKLDTPENPYHLRELSETEFSVLLDDRFKRLRFYTQLLRSAGWWSLRWLSSESGIWNNVRGFRRVHYFLQRHCCPELVDWRALQGARERPIESILAPTKFLSHVANAFSLRRRSRITGEDPVFLIAVASK